jgi:hypothetical protein
LPGARKWFLDKCLSYIRARKTEPGRRPPVSHSGSLGSNLTLPEKCATLVALHSIVCYSQHTFDPAPLRNTDGIRWATLVSNVNDGLQVMHRDHVESWLKDVETALRAELIPIASETHLSEPESRNGDDRPADKSSSPEKEPKKWLTIAEAHRISGINRGVISRAVDAGHLKSNGQTGKGKRKIDAADFARWLLERVKKPDPVESDSHVHALVRKHIEN